MTNSPADPDSLCELDQSLAELKSILSELSGEDPLRRTLQRLASHLIARESARISWTEDGQNRMRQALQQLNAMSVGRVGAFKFNIENPEEAE